VQLQKLEMEYSHSQQMLESTKNRHEDEVESLKQSHRFGTLFQTLLFWKKNNHFFFLFFFFSLRIKSLEDSLSRTETRYICSWLYFERVLGIHYYWSGGIVSRWTEELQLEMRRWQDKLKEAEKDKFEAVQLLQKKMDSMEASKISDTDQLKNNHMYVRKRGIKDFAMG